MSISLKNVEYFYPKSPEKPVIGIDSWKLASAEKHFIYGPSGSGKSTLLNLIGGLILPTAGTVSVLGQPIEKLNSHQRDKFRANNIGFIFQQFNLINYMNAVENIRLANHFSQHKKSSQLNERINTLLEALDIPTNDWIKPINNLSVGQQQRIAIARAFINSPKLLIADEPTSSLDETSRNNFMSLLTTLCEEHQTTLLFVSHDTRLKKHFNAVHNFDDINKVEIKQ